MTPDQGYAYLCGAVAGALATPLGWVACSPGGWALIAVLCELRRGVDR